MNRVQRDGAPGNSPGNSPARTGGGAAVKSHKRRELPTFYYHAHFLEMLAFIRQHYAHALGDAERRFLEDFQQLTFPAQCLYVRMLNRRGRLFARQRLRYSEIPNIDDVLRELGSAGFLDHPSAGCTQELVSLLTREQLFKALKGRVSGITGSTKKGDLVNLALQQATADQLFEWLPTTSIVVQGRTEASRFLLFLFFGRIQDGLTQFTMRDLGLVRAHDADSDFEPRFNDQEDAQQAYFFATRLDALGQGLASYETLYREITDWPRAEAPVAAVFRDRLALELGRHLEDDPGAALEVYRQGESVKCSERSIRLLLSSGQKEAARAYLSRCIENPSCDEEALLASDIYERKFNKKRTSALTDALRAAKEIDVDESYKGSAEYGAVLWFRDQGHQAYRVENGLWRTLFGLLFRDLLYESDNAGRHSPFERLPSSIIDGRFFTDNQQSIEQRLQLLEDREATRRFLLKVSASRFGTNNGIFRWRQPILDAMYALLDVAPLQATREILQQLCRDYMNLRHGYPDLMVIDDRGVRFVEVKADGDQLRRNQMLRLEQLRGAGFQAEVLKVRWVLHPKQAYAVVDVETTGGRGEQHRVTEVGVVKVVNGEVVDRFQTLINPQRNIPAGITRLTGITNDMVAEAPVFADIADALAAFLEGAIFVAHNVEFDYRFIGQEFQRLGHHFRMPKLCTCASMRKLFPGQKSYALGALTKTYDIALASHHRALCDAEAAAELLLIINEERQRLLSREVDTQAA